MNLRFKVGLAVVAGLIAITTAALAGIFPGFPIVGAPQLCWGSTSTATGSIIGVQTGCPNTSPTGPSIVSGGELIAADRYRLSTTSIGLNADNPATVLLSLGSLNALPISWQNMGGQTTVINSVSASNFLGGLFYHSTAAITRVNITLPLTPIDGQQFVLSADQPITTLVVTGGNSTSAVGPFAAPTSLSATNTASYGYRWVYNLGLGEWGRLQ